MEPRHRSHIETVHVVLRETEPALNCVHSLASRYGAACEQYPRDFLAHLLTFALPNPQTPCCEISSCKTGGRGHTMACDFPACVASKIFECRRIKPIPSGSLPAGMLISSETHLLALSEG